MPTFDDLLSDLVGAIVPSAEAAPKVKLPLGNSNQAQAGEMPSFDEHLADLVNSLGFGPMTDQSRAGRTGPVNATPGAELRAYQPTPGEDAGLAVRQGLTPYLGPTIADRLARLASGYTTAADAVTTVPEAPRNAEELGEAALYTAAGPVLKVAGPALRRAAPVVAGALAGTALTSSEAGSQDAADPVRQLQQELKAKGYYRGPIDGQMGPGTQEAQRRFQEDEARRAQQENERRQAEAAAKAAEAQAAQAEAERLETIRKREAEERAAAQRRAGEERLRDIDSNMSTSQRLWQEYGPIAGPVLGAALGYGVRGGIGKARGIIEQRAVERANRLMEAAGKGPVPDRIARVNQFYGEGQKGSQPPFVPDPKARSYKFRSNPNAPNASELYQPTFAGRYGVDVALPLVGAADRVGAEIMLIEPAREEMQKAYEALAADPSEANIQRFLAARDQLVKYETLGNAGTGFIAGSLGAGVKSQLKHSSPRPDVAIAEGERAKLDRLLSAARRKRP